MSQSLRQSELFTAQVWTVLYQALTSINFNASDPPSINRALRQYIQTNYAEDFNDWIAQSEMVIVLDTLSWLAGILAYKTDVSARENFFDTATARESILRLARFLSYNARRNQCAQGLLKVVAVQTNDDVYDSLGNNLNGTTILWNDQNNTDWFDQMALVLNAAMVQTNPFGIPLSTTTYNGIKAQIYRLNAPLGINQAAVGFTSFLAGQGTRFEIINLDYDPPYGFIEKTPDPASALQFTYQSDGFGNASTNTGFFFGFKQGQLQSQVTNIAAPVENQMIDIAVSNINQTDVWVQSIDGSGNTLFNWTQVPVVFSDNITFNRLPPSERNIFQVITRTDDQVTLRFSDGRFGNAPSGTLRSWYRVSNGLSYAINPSDMGNPRITLNYTNRRGATKQLTLTLQLETTVSNSAPAETIDQIRRRAPLVYATQNRMISGEDYNNFPLQSNLATKLKALNRTYSGQSRFIDLNDPTATYQDVTVFADDGAFYSEDAPAYAEIPLSDNLTAAQLIDAYIQPALSVTETANWARDQFIKNVQTGAISIPTTAVWTQDSSTTTSCTGHFNIDSSYFRPGAMICMRSPNGSSAWAGVASLSGSTTDLASTVTGAGPLTLSIPIPTGAVVTNIIPRYASTIMGNLRSQMLGNLGQNISFELWYDYAASDESQHLLLKAKGYTPTSSQLQLMTVDCVSGALWRISTVGLRYVFESRKAVQFYFDGAKSVDITTGQVKQDTVSILDINMDLNAGTAFGRNYFLTIDKMIRYASGLADPRRVAIKFTDVGNKGFPDDPDTFYKVVSANESATYLFWQATSPSTYAPVANMTVFEEEIDRLADRSTNVGTTVFQVNSPTLPNTFWTLTANGWIENWRDFRYGIGRGINVAATWHASGGSTITELSGTDIRYCWKHYVPGNRRVDPSRSNINDIFVLASAYDTAIRNWIAAGAIASQEPAVVSDYQLRQMFASYEPFKAYSDDIVWRPVRYRYLFGQTADPALRGQFKVIKSPTTSLSDGEIQGKVLSAINDFFNADLWDFGETFYYTELSAYLYTTLVGVISSIVIVPEVANGAFGDLFEVDCRADELFISTASVSDIIMIDANTATNLRIR